MTFNWFTFVAQIVNFLILLFLLRRFLYGPISKVMTERQESIINQIEEAKKREVDAETALANYHEQQSQLDDKREEIILEARVEADSTKKALVKKARTEVDSQKSHWQQLLEKEKEAFMQVLEKRISKEFYLSMRLALTDLADVRLEQQVLKVFIKRLLALTPAEQETLKQALILAKHDIQLITAFPLTLENQNELNNALQTLLKQEFEMHLEQRDDLVCGLELNIFDQRLSWSLESYLQNVQTAVAEKLSSKHSVKQEAPV